MLKRIFLMYVFIIKYVEIYRIKVISFNDQNKIKQVFFINQDNKIFFNWSINISIF